VYKAVVGKQMAEITYQIHHSTTEDSDHLTMTKVILEGFQGFIMRTSLSVEFMSKVPYTVVQYLYVLQNPGNKILFSRFPMLHLTISMSLSTVTRQ